MPKYNILDDITLSHNYIVYNWMNILCKDLDLSVGARNLFALVFSFTKDGRHKFNASQKYISDMLYCSITSIKRFTKELLDANLIIKSYITKNDTSRVEIEINESIIFDYFGCNLGDLYRLSNDSKRIINLCKNTNNKIEDPTETTKDSAPKQLILDFSVSTENGVIKSKPKPKPRETKKSKDNKFNAFIDCLKRYNYPDTVIESAKRYIAWLLKNRKVDISQWELMISTLNADLKQFSNKSIREQAALEAFDTAYANGYRKLCINTYKYNKYSANTPLNVDTQISDSRVMEVTPGVYEIVGAKPLDFVRNSDGDILEF